MQSQYAQTFEREMACTPAEWARWLPAAIGQHPWDSSSDAATVHIGDGLLHLQWQPGAARVIALMRLPRLLVSFRFEGVDADARFAFMRRFDLYLQRGGG